MVVLKLPIVQIIAYGDFYPNKAINQIPPWTVEGNRFEIDTTGIYFALILTPPKILLVLIILTKEML